MELVAANQQHYERRKHDNFGDDHGSIVRPVHLA
jgi:hypothetical protein